MKKLFALLFSFQLIVTPVFAAGTTQNEGYNLPGTEEASAEFKANATKSPGAEEDAYKTSGTGSKGGYDFYTSQILALTTSAVGTSILTSCTMSFKVPSLVIFFGGSVAHMASEFLGAKSSNEDHTKRIKDLSIKQSELVTKGDSAQKAVLEQRLAEEKATLKFLNNRKLWMTAVSVIYGTALGFAISESILHFFPTPPVPNIFYLQFGGNCTPSTSMINWGTALSMAYGMGASKLGSGGAVSQYGTMLISLMSIMVPSMNSKISVLYSNPIPRAITIGASLTLAGIVTSGLYVRAGKAKENIEKLEKVIAQFKSNTENPNTGIAEDVDGAGGDDEITDKIKGKTSIKPMVETKKKQCLSLSGGTANISEAACAKKLNISKANVPASFNLPAMNKVNNLTADMANALASGDEGLAASIAGEIGSYAARVQAETDALKKQYNEVQKQNNKPELDFDKSIKEQVATLQGSLNDAAKSGKVDLASMGAGSNKLDEDSTKPADAPTVTTVAPSPAVDIPVDPLAGLGGTEEVTLPEVKTAAAAQSLDDFESTEQDISKKPETSIFKQLSNRYILNYTKMFETKKTAEPAKPSPTN